MFLNLIFIVIGFCLLLKGASWLIDGSVTIARRYGVSDLLVGLTIVSLGTSAPELLVNLSAAWRGSTDIALGNVIGSNIANVLLILGASAVVRALRVGPSTVFKEIPFCLLASLLISVLANDTLLDGESVSAVTRIDGIVLLSFFLIYLYYLAGLRQSHESKVSDAEVSESSRARCSAWCHVMVGLVFLGIGGEIAVRGAVDLARVLEVSERVIGLTIIALGTSLPELLTSVVASFRGKADIAIGNIIGSNIFNIFWILGISAAIVPLPFLRDLNSDVAVMIFSLVLLLFLIQSGGFFERLCFWRSRSGHALSRWEGGLLLGLYIVYLTVVVCEAYVPES